MSNFSPLLLLCASFAFFANMVQQPIAMYANFAEVSVADG